MGLEGAVNPLNTGFTSGELSQIIEDRVGWVCAIEVANTTFGTGILVGPDLILTSYHVLDAVFRAPDLAAGVRVRFDFVEEDGVVRQGRPVALSGQWNTGLPKSRESDKDRAGADTGFEADFLDYAIVRLAEPVGEQPLGDARDAAGPQRRWLTIPDALREPAVESALYVVQHPQAGGASEILPQRWYDGKVLGLLDRGLRLRHDATTNFGSSGGACFDAKYNLVALHQSGDRQKRWNQAVPITAIVRHMRDNGFERLIGVAPPPRRPMVRRRSFEERVEEQLEVDIEHRLHGARMLMDRDDAENFIHACRLDTRNAGIVHLIACRHVDSHPNFVERLRYVSLEDLSRDALRKRQAALLGVAGQRGEPVWRKDQLDWPGPLYAQAQAARMIEGQIVRVLRERQRTILESVIMIDEYDPVRDRALLAHLGKLLAAGKARPDRLQIFVVFTDKAARGEPDQHAGLRRDMASLWRTRRPANCGASMALDDIGSLQLQDWAEAVQRALGLQRNEIMQAVERALPGGRRVPMLVAEETVLREIRPFLQATP